MPKKKAQTDRDIVIHYKGDYFMVKEATWRRGVIPDDGSLGSPMPSAAADNAEEVIDAGGIIGFVPDKKPGKLEGGYSTVINLDAILKGRPAK